MNFPNAPGKTPACYGFFERTEIRIRKMAVKERSQPESLLPGHPIGFLMLSRQEWEVIPLIANETGVFPAPYRCPHEVVEIEHDAEVDSSLLRPGGINYTVIPVDHPAVKDGIRVDGIAQLHETGPWSRIPFDVPILAVALQDQPPGVLETGVFILSPVLIQAFRIRL